MLGLISHEYFHTWNVKRLRPVEFARYDFGRENYTRLLWFFEGFTSYYDDLLLRRAGLVDDAAYLRLLTKTVNQVLQTPGRLVQSVAQASFDAWVKYYRQDENTANATVSYYTKGACVALCLDLALRRAGAHHPRRRDARSVAALPGRSDGARRSAGRARALQLGARGRAKLVAGCMAPSELPLRTCSNDHGVAVLEEPAQPAQALGIRVAENKAASRSRPCCAAVSPNAPVLLPATSGWAWSAAPARGLQTWRLTATRRIAAVRGAGPHRHGTGRARPAPATACAWCIAEIGYRPGAWRCATMRWRPGRRRAGSSRPT